MKEMLESTWHMIPASSDEDLSYIAFTTLFGIIHIIFHEGLAVRLPITTSTLISYWICLPSTLRFLLRSNVGHVVLTSGPCEFEPSAHLTSPLVN